MDYDLLGRIQALRQTAGHGLGVAALDQAEAEARDKIAVAIDKARALIAKLPSEGLDQLLAVCEQRVELMTAVGLAFFEDGRSQQFPDVGEWFSMGMAIDVAVVVALLERLQSEEP